jgi:hypothetical protein
MELWRTTDKACCLPSDCPVQSHLRRVFRLLAKTGVHGGVIVMGCSAACTFETRQVQGVRFIPQREVNDTGASFDGLWVAACGARGLERLPWLVARVKPGGGIIILAANGAADLLHVLLPALSQVQLIHQGPRLIFGLRRPDLDEARLARLAALHAPSRWRRIVKRTADSVLASAALVLALPLMIVIATLLRLTSPGPSLMRQVRVKQGGRLFTFYKFRTMPVDAKLRYPTAYAYDYPRCPGIAPLQPPALATRSVARRPLG